MNFKTSFIQIRKASADFYYNLNWKIPNKFNSMVRVPFNVCFLIIKIQILKYKLKNKNIIALSLVERIGDIVACEPVSRYLKKTNPNCYLIWIVKDSYRELVEFNPYIDKIICLSFFSEWILLKKFKLFNTVYDLHLNGKKCEFNKILTNPSSSKLNIDNYFEGKSLLGAFSLAANLPEIQDKPIFYFSKKSSFNIDPKLPFITIHCLSNEKEKDWSAEKWNELVEKLTLKKIAVFEVGVHSIINVNNELFRSYCSKLNLQQTAYLISKSRVFLGIDSGPAHIANAVGTYGIILLGKYKNFTTYNPYSGDYRNSKKSTLIRDAYRTSNISVDTVYNSVINKFYLHE